MVKDNVYYFQSAPQRESKAAWFIETYPQVAREVVYYATKFGIGQGTLRLENFVNSQMDDSTILYIIRHNAARFGIGVYTDMVYKFLRGGRVTPQPPKDDIKPVPSPEERKPFRYGYNKEGRREKAREVTRVKPNGDTFTQYQSTKTGRFLAKRKK